MAKKRDTLDDLLEQITGQARASNFKPEKVVEEKVTYDSTSYRYEGPSGKPAIDTIIEQREQKIEIEDDANNRYIISSKAAPRKGNDGPKDKQGSVKINPDNIAKPKSVPHLKFSIKSTHLPSAYVNDDVEGVIYITDNNLNPQALHWESLNLVWDNQSIPLDPMEGENESPTFKFNLNPQQTGEYSLQLFYEEMLVLRLYCKIDPDPKQPNRATKPNKRLPKLTKITDKLEEGRTGKVLLAFRNQAGAIDDEIENEKVLMKCTTTSHVVLDGVDSLEEIGACEISYMFRQTGKHVMRIFYDSAEVEGSPFNVIVE